MASEPWYNFVLSYPTISSTKMSLMSALICSWWVLSILNSFLVTSNKIKILQIALRRKSIKKHSTWIATQVSAFRLQNTTSSSIGLIRRWNSMASFPRSPQQKKTQAWSQNGVSTGVTTPISKNEISSDYSQIHLENGATAHKES